MLQTFQERFYDNFIQDDRWNYIWEGLTVTLRVTLFAVILGIVIGFLIAIIRSTYDKTGKMKILNFICSVYLTVIRGNQQDRSRDHGVWNQFRRLCSRDLPVRDHVD